MTNGAGKGVTLQISLAPNDLPTAVHTVPHQLRQLGGQVDEIDLTLDLHRSGGRYGHGWEGRQADMERFLEDVLDEWPSARVCRVDYSEKARAEVSQAFLGGVEVPLKARSGAPMHGYFWPLLQARHEYVFHLDADMLFGGGSQTWVAEAIQLLDQRDDVLVCCPLAGPPSPSGELPPHVIDRIHRWGGVFLGREPHSSLAYRLGHCSSRIWFTQRARFRAALCPVRLIPSPLRKRALARLDGNAPYENWENMISEEMRRTEHVRVDLLGEAPGLWSLHPLWRSEVFFNELPGLVKRVETGDMPDDQLGDYEIVDSLVDWSSVRAERERPVPRRERILWKLRLARALLRRDAS